MNESHSQPLAGVRPGLLATLGLSLILLGNPGSTQEAISPALLDGLEWREVGPFRGGRATTATGVPGDNLTYYMGATGGGLWKTTNAGVTWTNISEGINVGTIGAVAVAASDPNVLYVGTGESPIRGVTTSHGDGVYKSTDGGDTWRHIGLAATRHISKIRVHPKDPNLVYVGAQGNPWGPNPERGVYRSEDGGASWELVLAVDENTGVADLSMDSNNPRVLYAALWDHGRNPWFVRSGGPGSGLYKTVDGGDNWTELTNGLPDFVGKIGVSVSPADSQRVYAIVEAEKGGLYRSDNAGEEWRRLNADRIVQARAWYYNHITADSQDENTVYVLNVPLLKSIDGGETFEIIKTPHGDHHDHWINPEDNRNMINANDGGATITFDGGETWSREDNQPTAQFYRVATDNLFPYRIYGGQQDNTTVGILNRTLDDTGVGREDHFPVGGGESAHIVFDPDNPRFIYATTINGLLTEFDSKTRQIKPIKPYPEYVFGRDARDLKYRANWNAPLAISPHDPRVIYYGTQVLMETRDRGRSWREISGDLTRNEPDKQGKNGGPITNEQAGAEYYNTIFYIVESIHEPGTIWVGSDDGLVHITRDGGESWRNVTPRGLPEAHINSIEVSPYDPASAYVAVAGYKLNNFSPLIFKTTDYGKTWRRLVRGLPEDTFVRVVREDPDRQGLLYAGTEAGMFVSFDEGRQWQSLRLNMPAVPITDLTIRQGDIVAATQGRGFWVLDKPLPLRQVVREDEEESLKVYEPAHAYRLNVGGESASEFVVQAENPPAGASIYYYLRDAPQESDPPLQLEVRDSKGEIIRTLVAAETEHDQCKVRNQDQRSPVELKTHEPKAGLNKWVWDLRRDPYPCIDGMKMFAGWRGSRVMPGDYELTVTAGSERQTTTLTVLTDPRASVDSGQFQELDQLLAEASRIMESLILRLDRLRRARDQMLDLAELGAGANDENVSAAAEKISDRVASWEQQVIQPRHETFEDDINWPNMLDVQVMHLIRSSDSADVPVTAGARRRLEDLSNQWNGLQTEYDAILGEFREFNRLLDQQGIDPVVLP